MTTLVWFLIFLAAVRCAKNYSGLWRILFVGFAIVALVALSFAPRVHF